MSAIATSMSDMIMPDMIMSGIIMSGMNVRKSGWVFGKMKD